LKSSSHTQNELPVKEALAAHPLLYGAPQELFSELAAITRARSFEEHERVFDQGQTAHNLFLITSGSFLLQLRNGETKVLTGGSYFGEIGILNDQIRSGRIRANEFSTTLTICGDDLYDKQKVSSESALWLTRKLAVGLTQILRSKENISTSKLIESGESDQVEFKSTLRHNTHVGKPDRAVEHAVLKTIAAFMNTEGGTLLIGIADDGEKLGLELDNFPNEDKMLLHLDKLLRDRIDALCTRFVDAEVEELDGKQVLRVDCFRSTEPAYLRDNSKEYFYVRSGPGTINLPISEAVDYIREKWG
jgi:CRP-like cAMP-binding protein